MSILRQQNFLGQQRVDAPHLRALESAVAADFDVLAGRVMGGSRAMVVRGFTLTNITAGSAASGIQLSTADGIIFNVNSTEAGTLLWVPADRAAETLNGATNSRVDGSFTAGQVNYIGVDMRRSADDTTSDLVQFMDASSLLESPRNVPLARTLDYRIVISTTPFSSSPNIVPVAKVKTNAQNQIDSTSTAVEDARNLMFRLGTGGDFPSRYSSFTWPQNRVEQDPAISALQNLDKFAGADKGIRSQKDWMDAVMSRIWELGGGQNWYSPTADRNVRMIGSPSPAVFSATGDNFEWGIESGVPATGLYSVNHLHWQGLKITFDNSTVTGVYYNQVVDQTTDDVGTPATAAGSKTALLDGDCIYVDLDRTSNATVTAKKSTLQSLGQSAIPGQRIILAWRVGSAIYRRDNSLPVNVSYPVATTGATGSVRLSYNAGTPVTPTVNPLNSANAIVIGGGAYTIIGNNAALTATGGGTGAGALLTGGSNGNGLTAYGNGASGIGVFGQANGATYGGYFQGGTGSFGLFAQGEGAGGGVKGQGGSAAGPGVAGYGGNDGVGGYFEGGPPSEGGVGGYGIEVVSQILGASITSSGGDGINVSAGGNGKGIISTGSGTQGYGGQFTGGTAVVNPGEGIVATGGTSTGTDAAAGALIYGGAGAGANTNGGYGIVSTGGDGTGTGVGGAGGWFIGAQGAYGVLAQGGATNGIALFAYSQGTGHAVVGNATGTGLAFYAQTGDIGVPNTAAFRYTNGASRYIHVPSTDFQHQNGSVIVTAASGAVIGSNTGSIVLASTKIRLPHGSQIDSIEMLCYNDDATNRTITVACYHEAYSASTPGYTRTQVHTGAPGGAGFVITDPGPANPNWVSIPITLSLSAPDDGFTSLFFSLPVTSGTATVVVYGFRIGYTHTLESPMR